MLHMFKSSFFAMNKKLNFFFRFSRRMKLENLILVCSSYSFSFFENFTVFILLNFILFLLYCCSNLFKSSFFFLKFLHVCIDITENRKHIRMNENDELFLYKRSKQPANIVDSSHSFCNLIQRKNTFYIRNEFSFSKNVYEHKKKIPVFCWLFTYYAWAADARIKSVEFEKVLVIIFVHPGSSSFFSFSSSFICIVLVLFQVSYRLRMWKVWEKKSNIKKNCNEITTQCGSTSLKAHRAWIAFELKAAKCEFNF